MITATEVAYRQAEWERTELPKIRAACDAFFNDAVEHLYVAILAHFADEQLQQDRMTDDGCPN